MSMTSVPTKSKSKKIRASKKMSRMARREELQGYIFILPWIIGFIGLQAGPMLFSLYGSFTNYDVTSQMDFVGFQNYIKALTFDPLFWKSLYNTVFYVIFSVPLTTLGSMLIALLLNQNVRGMRIFRTVYYLPAVLTGVAVYLLWLQLLSPVGLINEMLSWLSIDGPAWMLDPNWTKPALILMSMWNVGGGMLLYLAALQGVPKSLYESAEIDGATAFRKFLHISFPMITPVIFFDLVTSLIGGFHVFQEAYVMTKDGGGGPLNSLMFYNLHMWNKAFEAFDMGYAMSMTWMIFLIIMGLTLINLKLAPKWVHYEGEDK
ncbi:MAG TPA: sugar ABC transporter permease [Bacillales bacterium]